MTSEVREAIDSGDATLLQSLLSVHPEWATADIELPDGSGNRVPPLHYVCDVVFRRQVERQESAQLAGVLLAAGVDPNASYAKSGDSYLIAAASLGAEDVGLLLLQHGADVGVQGLFEATALHWSAIMGLPKLAQALLEAGASTTLRDEEYDCTPRQWAEHAQAEGTNGYPERIPDVLAVFDSFDSA